MRTFMLFVTAVAAGLLLALIVAVIVVWLIDPSEAAAQRERFVACHEVGPHRTLVCVDPNEPELRAGVIRKEQ